MSAADGFDGSTLVSHETLARCGPDVLRRAVRSFATDDVRVVVTARDLARQIPSVWQERIKNRGTLGYDEFLHELFGSEQGRRRKGGFWLPQHLPSLAQRWIAEVGADRFTLVTVPPSGAAPDELWRRFAAATGVPDAAYDLEATGSNPSLGVVESELLRRLNPKLADVPWPQYETRVKRGFAEGELATFSHSARLAVPPRLHEEVRQAGEEMIGYFASAGCRVVGDLDDLRPRLDDTATTGPDQVTDAEVLDVALGLVARHAARPRGRALPSPRSLGERVRARTRDLVAGRRRERAHG